MSREIMQQALDALKLHLTHHEHGCVYLNPIMYALEAELAKPEQEPEQAEALRLANWLETKIPPDDKTTFADVAKKLRQQHEEIKCEEKRFNDLWDKYAALVNKQYPESKFDDPRVQVVYEILCADEAPPKGEHWEGFIARRIVDALAKPEQVSGDTSDGYHTFNELYEFRKAYNAALFNEWAASNKYSVHKSKRHFDGEDCFGGGWFIVVAQLPDGQISNHYEMKDWDKFLLPETDKAMFEYDNHTGADVLQRLFSLRQELAKPEQTYDHESDAMSVLADVNADLIQDAKPEPVNRSWLSKGNPANAPVRNSGAPPKPEQEPVRWFQQFGDAPPRKPWVGLTREEIVEAYCSIHVKEWAIGGMDDVLPFTRAIEAKLKEKNT